MVCLYSPSVGVAIIICLVPPPISYTDFQSCAKQNANSSNRMPVRFELNCSAISTSRPQNGTGGALLGNFDGAGKGNGVGAAFSRMMPGDSGGASAGGIVGRLPGSGTGPNVLGTTPELVGGRLFK